MGEVLSVTGGNVVGNGRMSIGRGMVCHKRIRVTTTVCPEPVEGLHHERGPSAQLWLLAFKFVNQRL